MPQSDYNKHYFKGKKWRVRKLRQCTDCGRRAVGSGGRCSKDCEGRMWVVR